MWVGNVVLRDRRKEAGVLGKGPEGEGGWGR